jgi:opacity protein-like surface antigen
MRLSVVPAIVLGSSLLSIGSAAAAGNYATAYLGLRGSYVFTDDGSTQATNLFNYNEGYEDGYAASAYISWVVASNMRLELEGGFRSADLDEVTMVNNTTNYVAGQVVDVGADVQAATVMANVYYDFDIDAGLRLWAGGGLGGAHIEYNVVEPFGDIAGNDRTWVFAYQLMAGVTIPISDGLAATIGYRYFTTEDFDRVGTFGTAIFKTDLTQQSIDFGLQFQL